MKNTNKILATLFLLVISLNIASAFSLSTLLNNSQTVRLPNYPVSSIGVQVYNQTWLNFTGVATSNNQVNVTYNSLMNVTNFTILMGFKSFGKDTLGTLVNLGHGEVGHAGWRIFRNTNGWYYLYATNITGGTAYNCRPLDSDRQDNNFHYAILTYDTSVGFRWFWDNSFALQTGNCDIRGYLNYSNRYDFLLGNSFDRSQEWNGSINYIYFLNKTLNDTEVLEYYPSIDTFGVAKKSVTARYYYFNSSYSLIAIGSNVSYVSSSGNSTLTETFQFPINTASPYGLFVDNNSIAYASFLYNGTLWKSTASNMSAWTPTLYFQEANQTLWGDKSITQDDLGNLYVAPYSSGDEWNYSIIYKLNYSTQTWFVVYNSTSSRHTHFIKFNPYNKKLYASLGDFGNSKRIMVSSNYGITWTDILNNSQNTFGVDNHPIDVAFINETAYFTSDSASNNHIFKTSDDSTFIVVYNLTTAYDLPVYWIRKDYRNWLYFGTGEGTANKNASIWFSKDLVNFYKYAEFNVSYSNYTNAPSNFNQYNQFYILIGGYGQLSQGYQTTSSISGAVLKLNLNEYEGTKVYDSSGNGLNGTIINATWQTDGILVSLVEGTDYLTNLPNGLYALANQLYDKSYAIITYAAAQTTMCSNTLSGLQGFGDFVPLIIIGIVLVVVFGFLFMGNDEGAMADVQGDTVGLIVAIIAICLGAVIISSMLGGC